MKKPVKKNSLVYIKHYLLIKGRISKVVERPIRITIVAQLIILVMGLLT
jgi:hypothetical protein